ncbi:TylF/MycF/NovP-related O-methyltransferase [Terricaulis sp.]|uniref:TylF/MycF/NovP-related O-methyltransferase n=1 Tax=Terricaulis sp. TaxID=2768686 RepID=UPI0037832FE6
MTALSDRANRDAYIDLIKRSITNHLYLGEDAAFADFRSVKHYDVGQAHWKIDAYARPITLLSLAQLDLVEQAVLAVEQRGVPGDFIEAGVWRGGVIVLMRALLKAHGITARKIFAADSFAGIPKNTRALNDPVDKWRDRWVAPIEEVRQNIARFGLLDDKITFVPGFFADTLQHLADQRFAVVRLDSDSYDSVEESLVYLYPLLAPGGVIIIDDWHLVGCQQAVLNYRARHGIVEDLKVHDGNAYWTKA